MEKQDQAEQQVETKQEAVETQEEAVEAPEKQVHNLLNPDENQEETKNESEESQEETQDEPEEIQSAEPVVSDELIEQFSTLKMYRGKPLSVLPKAYDSLVRKLTEQATELKTLKGKLEQSSLNELGDPPDYYTEREEFDKWLEKRDKLIKSQQPEPTPQRTG